MLTRGTAIAIVWGIGLAIIGIGYLLGTGDSERTDGYGDWFMVGGFAVVIALSIIGLLTKKSKTPKEQPISNARTAKIEIDPEKITNWLDKFATWSRGLTIFLVGLVSYVLIVNYVDPTTAPYLEPIAGIVTLFGGGILMWMLSNINQIEH